MPRALLIFVVAITAGTVLAVVFWLAGQFFAPPLFSALWYGPRSSFAPIAYAAIAPIIVAIPFGCAFGFVAWRHPASMALSVALLAAGLNIAIAVWASVWAGYAPFGPRAWMDWLEAGLLVALFGIAAVVCARAASAWRGSTRNVIGGVMLGALTLVVFVGSYWSYQSLLARAA